MKVSPSEAVVWTLSVLIGAVFLGVIVVLYVTFVPFVWLGRLAAFVAR